MLGISNYFGFLFSGIVLNITPGSDTLLILSRSVSNGKKAGIVTLLGIISGATCHTLFAAFGLSAILMQSELAFNIVRWIGGLYLLYLGIHTLMQKQSIFENQLSIAENHSNLQLYKQGLFTNLLNPKVAVFYLSFLPQFILPTNVYGATPFIILGFTFIITGTIWCFIVIYLASYVSQFLKTNSTINYMLQKATGVLFVILSCTLIFE